MTFSLFLPLLRATVVFIGYFSSHLRNCVLCVVILKKKIRKSSFARWLFSSSRSRGNSTVRRSWKQREKFDITLNRAHWTDRREESAATRYIYYMEKRRTQRRKEEKKLFLMVRVESQHTERVASTKSQPEKRRWKEETEQTVTLLLAIDFWLSFSLARFFFPSAQAQQRENFSL